LRVHGRAELCSRTADGREMNAQLRRITTLDEALSMAPAIDAYAAQAMAEFLDGPLPEGISRRFFKRHFEAGETVLLVAESARGKADLGVCVTGPFEDPLLAMRVPMILILFVSPDVRHRGLAHAMVEAVSETLLERGHATIAARAGHNDDALISMGERWGFVRQWEMMLRE
jgi:GNAT superfamily N-acetyltransferase